MESYSDYSWPATALIFMGAFCTGCGGSGGAAGSSGAAGPTGTPGPTGPSGDAPITSAERINARITGVDVPTGGGAPTVLLLLTNDLKRGLTGLPAANISFLISQLTPGSNGGSSEWQSYITRESGGIPDAQAATEPATAGSYVDNGDGTYEYTFANALTGYPAGPTFDANKTHRVGIEIRTMRGDLNLPENIPANNAPFDFLPSGGAPIFTRLIVDNDTCNACHDNLEQHGEARFDVEYCVQCHNPSSIDGDTANEPWGGKVDMKVMIHKIHYGAKLANGYTIIGFGGTPHDFSDVEFPQDVRNCTTCHDESDADTPQASNWRRVANRETCGACHDAVNFGNAGHPGGMTFVDDSQCLDCHGPDSMVNNGDLRTAQAHRLLDQEASAQFAFNILSITDTNTGEFPSVTFSVTDPTNLIEPNKPYDIGADPAFTACDGSSRLAIDIGWSTSDYTNRDSGNLPALPISLNPLTACGGTAQDNLDGTFTVTSNVAMPATVIGSLGVAIEGHPWVDLNGDGLSERSERIAVTAAVDFAGINGATAVERRQQVDITKCQDCHKQLSLHGSNRTDEPRLCVMCHNPNMTDINRRGGGACLAELGPDDTPIDFKFMIHRIHASGRDDVPSYDVCGFSTHSFEVVYPGRLNNCEGCHQPDGYYPAEPDEILGTTVDAGPDPSTPTDDTVVSPNTAICSACHVDALAIQHMEQNGGDFAAAKAADSTLISSSIESCTVCHGPGRTADVKEVHGVDTFQFN